MSRKRKSEPRKVNPDSIHQDLTIAKFINCMQFDGKKAVAEKIFYGSLFTKLT